MLCPKQISLALCADCRLSIYPDLSICAPWKSTPIRNLLWALNLKSQQTLLDLQEQWNSPKPGGVCDSEPFWGFCWTLGQAGVMQAKTCPSGSGKNTDETHAQQAQFDCCRWCTANTYWILQKPHSRTRYRRCQQKIVNEKSATKDAGPPQLNLTRTRPGRDLFLTWMTRRRPSIWSGLAESRVKNMHMICHSDPAQGIWWLSVAVWLGRVSQGLAEWGLDLPLFNSQAIPSWHS